MTYADEIDKLELEDIKSDPWARSLSNVIERSHTDRPPHRETDNRVLTAVTVQ